VVGVITGKALYSGTLDLHEAIQLAKKAGAWNLDVHCHLLSFNFHSSYWDNFYLVSERKVGFFVQIKKGENFNHRNT
jgi:hypothetical protein